MLWPYWFKCLVSREGLKKMRGKSMIRERNITLPLEEIYIAVSLDKGGCECGWLNQHRPIKPKNVTVIKIII